MDRHQKDLPFAEAEGSRAERRNMLGLALMKIGVDAAESRLAEWIFNVTDGGQRGELRKSYDELAARPWGLCCSRSKARAAVLRLRQRGILEAEETISRVSGQVANAYRIHWPGVRELLGLPNRVSPQDTGVPCGNTPLPSQDTGVPSHGTPYKENPSSKPLLDPDRNRYRNRGPDRCPEDLPTDQLRKAAVGDLAHVPEIARHLDRAVEPLPAGDLVRGVFAPLGGKTFQRPDAPLIAGQLAVWFRRQLAVPDPLFGNTAAELLLVIAAGIYAARLPQADVRKNRVAVFASICSRRAWSKVLRYLDQAEAGLAAVQAERGVDLLACPDGAWRTTPAEC